MFTYRNPMNIPGIITVLLLGRGSGAGLQFFVLKLGEPLSIKDQCN